MSYRDHSNLDDQLNKMKTDVKWRAERQRKSREELISKIDQKSSSQKNKLKNIIKRKLAPAIAIVMIIGISTTLMFNGSTSTQQSIADDATTPKNVNEMDSMNNIELPYEISEETKHQIKEIMDSGFDIRLPHTSISDDMYIINTNKRTNGEVEEVSTLFGFKGDKQFRLSQESIKNQNEPINERIRQRISQIKEESTDILHLENGMEAYLMDEKNDKTLYILSGNYGFVLHSHRLSTEQILSLANSIQLENLE